MNIGFDLDKVLIDYPPFVPGRIIDRIYKKKSNGTLSYRIPKKPEQILRLASHHPYLRKPISENLSFVKDLASQKNNNKFYLISSRFGFLQKITEQLVKKQELHEIFDELYFNFHNLQPHLFKEGILKKIKLQKYVDDDLLLLKYLADKNPKTSFYWLNSKVSLPISTNIQAITKLSQILKDS